MANNGELGNGCVGLGFEFEMQVITIDMACLADGGGGGGGTSGTSGTSGTGTTGSGPTGGSTNTGSNNPNPNQSILDLFNTTFVPCTSCIELSEELNDFLSDLNATQLEWWNSLDNRTKESIVNYLNDNDYSADSIQLIEDLQIACDEYLTLYGNNSSTQFFIKNVIKNILNPQTHITPEEEVVLPPDCESFNFVNTSSNWQEAALTNVHFKLM